MNKNNFYKIPVFYFASRGWLLRIAAASLCLLLAGCAAPAGRSSAISSPPETAAPSFPAIATTRFVSPRPEVTPAESIPTFGSMEDMLPARWIPVAEDGEPVYVMEDSPYKGYSGNGCYTLSGPVLSGEKIEALGQSLLGTPAEELLDVLERQGIESSAMFGIWPQSEAPLRKTACFYILEGDYIQLTVAIAYYRDSQYAYDVFFEPTDGGYRPYSLLYHKESSDSSFIEFAGHRWVVYTCGDHYRTDVIWYNLDSRQIELCYCCQINEAGPAAHDVYETERWQAAQPKIIEDAAGSRLEIDMQIQFETKYWDVTEGCDLIMAAPEPDAIAFRTKTVLHYDQAASAFYILTPKEAYPLDKDRRNRAQWLFYIGDYMQDLLENGNVYQKRWASTFFPSE